LFIARLGVVSSQVTVPVSVYGYGLSFEAEAKKRPDAAQPVFKVPHVSSPV
jgi:hypothetical protein